MVIGSTLLGLRFFFFAKVGIVSAKIPQHVSPKRRLHTSRAHVARHAPSLCIGKQRRGNLEAPPHVCAANFARKLRSFHDEACHGICGTEGCGGRSPWL